MYTHPGIAATLDHDRHRAMRADIGQARQLRYLATAARRAQAAPRRAWRPVLWLRARAHA
jgi:hypothetical protein